ncbi:1-acyl-sn-glycerol-3-phosphate acyltransferase [Lacunisphaera limnophila]|uniref:1-acyl-sn-glycerol-3-phosphate acyltransferase n=1 Tax=Lacunisphaera limnophila TaxID=1838286 RepID=A0A1D8AWR5_9BACT|nr:lysophospholipid acyltransferase family protein [Lacunisphaera limnophila]AOS45334.1 1-acyl-sn-glycerol-3-phosphate acyltransferase [Lacunisphaera limnophila]
MSRTPDVMKLTPFYGFFHYLASTIHSMWFRGDVAGTDNFPVDGPFLIASNHASHLDPPLVGCHVARQMRFFARKSLWSNRAFAWWLNQVETIPVERDSGDIGAIKRVLQALKENRAVVLFPEGTRSPDGLLHKPKAGVGLMACKTGVPVVPCRIYGSFQAFGKGAAIPSFGSPVTIVFGPPISAGDYDDPAAGKARYETAAQRIMDRIAAIPAPAYPVI